MTESAGAAATVGASALEVSRSGEVPSPQGDLSLKLESAYAHAVSYAQQAMKTAVLMNSGAIGVLLTLIVHLLDKGRPEIIVRFIVAVKLFCASLLMGCMAGVFGYYALAALTGAISGVPGEEARYERNKFLALCFLTASLLGFTWGTFHAINDLALLIESPVMALGQAALPPGSVPEGVSPASGQVPESVSISSPGKARPVLPEEAERAPAASGELLRMIDREPR